MTVNEFAKAIHENAVAHGWYDSPVDFPTVAVMVHAEISEAVEEWRGGNPLVYGTCALAADGCKYSGVCDRVGEPGGDGVDGRRPLQAGGRSRGALRRGYEDFRLSRIHGRRY